MSRFIVRSFLEDIKNFRNMIPCRMQKIEESSSDPLPETYGVNELSLTLHPDKQKVTISSVSAFDSKTKIITLSPCDERTLAPFRAGQGINISVGNETTFFPILSDPNEKDYTIMVYADFSDKVSEILFNVSENTELEISGPTGLFYYSALRDGNSVVLICDAFGVASAVSICRYLAHSAETTAIVILLDEDNKENICSLFENIAENIKVLSLKKVDEINKKILSEVNIPSAFLVSGKEDFCSRIKAFVESFEYLRGRVRLNIAQPSVKIEVPSEKYSCQVFCRDEIFSFECFSDETLSSAFEKNNIPTEAKCKVGECGYCRCKLVEGKVETVLCNGIDSVRSADEKYGFIHPCRAFPKTDIKVKL